MEGVWVQQMLCLLLKLNVGSLEDTKEISFIEAGNLGCNKGEIYLFKCVLKKYDYRGGTEEAGFTLEAIVNQRATCPDESVCLCRGRG